MMKIEPSPKVKTGLYLAWAFLNAAVTIHKPDKMYPFRPETRLFMQAGAATAGKLGNGTGAHFAGYVVGQAASVALLPHEVASSFIEAAMP